jgi:hypothetical protein
MHHCGPIHGLPEDLWIEGVIALDEEMGFYTFYRATTEPAQVIEQRLIKVKAKGIRLFEGFKQQLIAIVKPLNDAIRANKKMLDIQPTPRKDLPCPVAI